MSSVVGVDVGGTFTDVYVFDSDGTTRAAKSPSTPDAVDGVLAALKQVVEASDVSAFTFGSTIATNALAERRLGSVGVLATTGFRDTLEIRRLWRRDLFGHEWDRPSAIVPRRLRFEVGGRIDWHGIEVEPLAEQEIWAAADHLEALGVESVAVAFLFSYLNPTHELRAGEILRERLGGHIPVLLSSDINPERNEYERTSTTAIAAGLAPIVDRALGALESRLVDAGLRCSPRIMKSNGGVMSIGAARARPVELIKSGPAGGAAAGAFISERLNEPNLILIDIGGTTADASMIVDGRAVRADRDALEWDVPIRVPVVDIKTIGAGGGSIARLDKAGALRVGPRSAGAVPGPVAYGQGGVEPTVTDAALVAGIMDPEQFLGGQMALDIAAARLSLQPIADGLMYPVEKAAAAALHVVMVEMATLLRSITIEHGIDPRDLTLVAFGGAGPLFASSLLEELAMRRAVVPLGASTLSAMGGAFADVTFDYRRSEVALVTEISPDRLHSALAEMLARARVDLMAEGFDEFELKTSVDLRYAGQWHEIEIALAADENLFEAAGRFEEAHERQWGHRRPEDAIQLTGVRVRALSRVAKPVVTEIGPLPDPALKGIRPVTFFKAGTIETPIFDRTVLGAGAVIAGPAIIEEAQTTTLVSPGTRLEMNRWGDLELLR